MKKKALYLLLTFTMMLVLTSASTAQGPGLIRGVAFDDLNQNGVRDIGEPGLADTAICLVGHNWCDYTEWGEYEFDLLPPGRYKVRLIEYPAGYRPTTRKQYVIKLRVDEFRTNVHFGLTNKPGQDSRKPK